jgi:hypothetical protein
LTKILGGVYVRSRDICQGPVETLDTVGDRGDMRRCPGGSITRRHDMHGSYYIGDSELERTGRCFDGILNVHQKAFRGFD